MRVVVDTNILVSFAIRPNPAFERMFDHISVHGESLVSEDTIAELFDVLSRDKFRKYITLDSLVEHGRITPVPDIEGSAWTSSTTSSRRPRSATTPRH